MQVTRTINLTGRKKIPRNRVSIQLFETEEGELAFDASLDLSDFSIPADSKIIIQPYYKSSAMWFDCGTTASFELPENTKLTDIDNGGPVLFRVLIVDAKDEAGKIIASAERVPVKDPADEEDRESLIKVRERDIGHEVWKLELEDGLEKPELIINNSIPGAAELVGDHGVFLGLMLPSVIRLIMGSIFSKGQESDGDEENWPAMWIKFAEELSGEEIPKNQDSDENVQWIDALVAEFSKSHRLCHMLNQKLGVISDA